jgi:hypothetical protein
MTIQEFVAALNVEFASTATRSCDAVTHHIPTFNSALGHLLAMTLHRTFEVVLLFVILKCIEYGFIAE